MGFTNSSDPLASVPFLVNLAQTLHVKSIPLAIFIFIIILLSVLIFILLIIFCIRYFIRRRFPLKRTVKKPKPIYVDEIPGLVQNIEHSKYGSLEYSLEYNVDKEALKIGILRANNLIKLSDNNNDNNTTSSSSTTTTTTTNNNNDNDDINPYVIITLTEDDGSQMKLIDNQEKTNVFTQTNKPCWQEIFVFKINERKLKRIYLSFTIFHYDKTRTDQCLGNLEIAMKDLDPSEYTGQVLEKIGWLTSPSGNNFGLGELCIGLGYYPHSSRIDICIYEAKQLILDRWEHKLTSNKFRKYEVDIVVLFKYHNKILQQNKTIKRKELISPYFNHKITFPIKTNKLDCNYFIICDIRLVGRLNEKYIIGQVCIGANSNQTKGVKQWFEMIENPSKMNVMWHPIMRPKN